MEAKDLRIGNYAFTYKPEMFGIIKAISASRDGTVYLEVGSISYPNLPITQLMPILLTPEILDKCGFEKNVEYNNVFGNGVISIYFDGKEVEYKGTCAKYLHTLQNYYPAWCNGKELEVKL